MHWLTDRTDLWAFLAVPIGIWGAVAATLQIVVAVRTTLTNPATTFQRLKVRMRTRRIEGELTTALDGQSRLRATLLSGGRSPLYVENVYNIVRGGRSVRITGDAGAGKSTLSLMLIEEGLRRNGRQGDDPLIEVAAAPFWRTPIGRRDWKALHHWVARELDREYPGFGRRYFRRLLKEQDLIPCVDGIDELPAGRRVTLIQCLTSAARRGFPVVLLGRAIEDYDLAATSHGSPNTLAERPLYETFTLAHLDDADVLDIIAIRPAWKPVLAAMEEHFALVRALRNPMLLQAAIATWGPDEEPRALLEATDPEYAIWESFVERRTSAFTSAEAAAIVEFAEASALLTLQRSQNTFRWWELYAHPLAGHLVAAVTLAAIGFLLVDPAAPLASANAVCLGWYYCYRLVVAPRRSHGISTVALLVPLVHRRLLSAATFVLVLQFAGFVAFKIAQETVSGYAEISYWDHLTANWVVVAWNAVAAAGLGYILSAGGAPAVNPTQDWGAMFSEKVGVEANAVRIAGAFLLVAGSLGLGWWFSGWMTMMGYGLLVPVTVAIGACALTRFLPGGSVAQSRRGCRDLLDIGVLRKRHRGYQFRHQALSEALARRRLATLIDQNRIREIPDPWATPENPAVADTVDERSLERADRLTGELVRRHPDMISLQIYRHLFLAFGTLDPITAERGARRFVRRNAGSPFLAALGEALDEQGRHDEAARPWQLARDASIAPQEDSDWARYRWVRHEIQHGEPDLAKRTLERLITRHPGPKSDIYRVLEAEIESRFGDVELAYRRLDALRRHAETEAARRATIECARIEAEHRQDLVGARSLLEPLHGMWLEAIEALFMARCAQVELRSGNASRARALGAEAIRTATWTDDPTHQLEALVTGVIVRAPAADEAAHRVQRLTGCRWSLWYRTALQQLSSHADPRFAEMLHPAFVRGGGQRPVAESDETPPAQVP